MAANVRDSHQRRTLPRPRTTPDTPRRRSSAARSTALCLPRVQRSRPSPQWHSGSRRRCGNPPATRCAHLGALHGHLRCRRLSRIRPRKEAVSDRERPLLGAARVGIATRARPRPVGRRARTDRVIQESRRRRSDVRRWCSHGFGRRCALPCAVPTGIPPSRAGCSHPSTSGARRSPHRHCRTTMASACRRGPRLSMAQGCDGRRGRFVAGTPMRRTITMRQATEALVATGSPARRRPCRLGWADG